MSALEQGLTTLAGTGCGPPLAAAGRRFLVKAAGVLGGCDCGGEVMLDVEAVSPRGAVDRRVPTADVDAGLGLMRR